MLHGNAGPKPGALNPTLRRLLDHCGFDRRFVQGQGVWLSDENGRRFLDGHAQYGALALGHNHPVVLAAAQQALAAFTPAMVQPYRAPHAEALADALAELCGLPNCILGCTGAEVVEAALKAVRRKSGRVGIITAHGSYHGKTLGALAATAQPQHQHGFGPLPPGFLHVPYGNAAALAELLAQRSDEIAAVLLEPIQGERGVIVPPSGYLATVRALCSQHGVALILDEIQTGLGRCGGWFAYQHEGISPDVLLLAKALGGGLFPLSACLFADAFWDDDFALHHSSTFANNNIACFIALAVLRELADGVITAAAARGEQLQARLQRLPARFPRSVASVRGRGLFAAIDLHATAADDGFLLGYLSQQGLLAYAVAASLAEHSRVIVLPSLGATNTLRIAPPLIIDAAQLDTLCAAIESGLCALEQRHSATFAQALLATRSPPARADVEVAPAVHLPLPPPTSPPHSLGPHQPATYAFLIHYSSLEDVLLTDPALASLRPTEIAAYSRFMSALPAGVVLRAPLVRSRTGAEAQGFLIAVPMLPAQMLRAGRRRVGSQIQRAVDLAASLGAQVVGLGGFTTPYSRRGLDVLGRGPAITTGNSLTAVMAVTALCRTAAHSGRPLAQQRVAVLGARGSVGALCARLLAARRPRQLILLGNPGSSPQPLQALADSLAAQLAGENRQPTSGLSASSVTPNESAVRIEVTHDLHALRDCTLILTASGAGRPIVDSTVVAPGTILCDVARPFDVAADVRARRDVTVLNGGLVALPDPSLRFGAGNLLGLPTGVQLACLCETLVLALSDERRDFSCGDDIPLSDAYQVAALAQQHGFSLAPTVADPPQRQAEPLSFRPHANRRERAA